MPVIARGVAMNQVAHRWSFSSPSRARSEGRVVRGGLGNSAKKMAPLGKRRHRWSNCVEKVPAYFSASLRRLRIKRASAPKPRPNRPISPGSGTDVTDLPLKVPVPTIG